METAIKRVAKSLCVATFNKKLGDNWRNSRRLMRVPCDQLHWHAILRDRFTNTEVVHGCHAQLLGFALGVADVLAVKDDDVIELFWQYWLVNDRDKYEASRIIDWITTVKTSAIELEYYELAHNLKIATEVLLIVKSMFSHEPI